MRTGQIASYAWEGSGEFDDPTMSEVEWTAPSPAAATSYTLSVTAVDNDGESSEAASIVARVAGVPPTPNRPPTVVLERAGSSNYTVSGGARFIILKATVSDPDGNRFGPGNFEFTGDGLLSRTTTVHQNPVRGLKDWSPAEAVGRDPSDDAGTGVGREWWRSHRIKGLHGYVHTTVRIRHLSFR